MERRSNESSSSAGTGSDDVWSNRNTSSHVTDYSSLGESESEFPDDLSISPSHKAPISERGPRCWDHGCNGRLFSTIDDFLQHGASFDKTRKSPHTCHDCGVEFERWHALKNHLFHETCLQRSTDGVDKQQRDESSDADSSLTSNASNEMEPALSIILSCHGCRERNILCDRKFPSCGSCVRTGRAKLCASTRTRKSNHLKKYPREQESGIVQAAFANRSVDHSEALHVKALYDYNGKATTDLTFQRGDIIRVYTQLENGWWDGVLNDVRGWFPSNYCKAMGSNLEYQANAEIASARAKHQVISTPEDVLSDAACEKSPRNAVRDTVCEESDVELAKIGFEHASRSQINFRRRLISNPAKQRHMPWAANDKHERGVQKKFFGELPRRYLPGTGGPRKTGSDTALDVVTSLNSRRVDYNEVIVRAPQAFDRIWDSKDSVDK